MLSAKITEAGHAWRGVRVEAAVNRVLGKLSLTELEDPDEGPSVCEGRTSLDHHGSSVLAKLGEIAGDARPHCNLLAVNPYRLVYVPRMFDVPLVTDYVEAIAGREVKSRWGRTARRPSSSKIGAPPGS